MMNMVRRKRTKVEVHLSLPPDVVEDIDSLADESEMTRTNTILTILTYVLSDDEIVDDIFGPSDEEENGEE